MSRMAAWLLVGCGLVVGCGPGDDAPVDEPDEVETTPPDVPSDGTKDSDGDGISDADEDFLGTNPGRPDRPCAEFDQVATWTTRPVDVILVVDNSASMTGEIHAIQDHLNRSFAAVMAASGLDYRIILLARHGNVDRDQSICISRPLSLTSCEPIPAAPVSGDHFFQYDREIGSTDSLQLLLETFHKPDPHGLAPGGWSDWLRKDASRVIVEITDDDSFMKADGFEEQLFAMTTAFGNAAERNYTFHSIIGMAENTPATRPWMPTDPIQHERCQTVGANGSEGVGVDYQELSRRTGGLRFPLCPLAGFEAVFQAVAKGVIEGQPVDCRVEPSSSVNPLDLDRTLVTYTPGEGPSHRLSSTSDPASCGADSFYSDGTGITLCPTACEAVKADPEARLTIQVGCEAQVD